VLAQSSAGGGAATQMSLRLADLGQGRLELMDEAGIDVQVISHAPSAFQQLEPPTAVALAPRVNDRLREAIALHPDRLAAFAILPTQHAEAAADELERTVRQLGFRGALIQGRSRGRMIDDRAFWPIFERAQSLDVPIYLHPGQPSQAVAEAYYQDYASTFPGLNGAAWGYTIDTASQAIRLILSGLFEAYPRLNLILGHLGESLPFMLDRIDEALNRGAVKIAFRDLFCRHFHVTTSGFFSTPALLCSILQLGVDRVLFSVDYPFVENRPATAWMNTVPLSNEDTRKMLGGNARRLLKW
jgi:predicted TIM-barrel fold metal-dependent hydrolase